MPALVTIDVERKLMITVCSDTVTDEEFVQARKQVLADPTFDPSFDRLWDFSAVTKEQVSDETIAYLVETSPFEGDISRAVVVSMLPRGWPASWSLSRSRAGSTGGSPGQDSLTEPPLSK
jgi:hypothetical protein